MTTRSTTSATRNRTRKPAGPAAAAKAPLPVEVAAEPAEIAARNDVLLLGRLPAAAQTRELPSGDIVASFRLVVRRDGRQRPGAPTVDTLDCAAWTAAHRRVLARLGPGSVLEVRGQLERRFWRAGGATVSRCEVRVCGLRVVTRCADGAPGPSVASA